MTGLYGKLPAHGDFVRRALPSEFVARWDAWLQLCLEAARQDLGDRFRDVWVNAPCWCFNLPPGACCGEAVAGVLLPSQDMGGRMFPLTLAVTLPTGAPPPAGGWYTALAVAGCNARMTGTSADDLLAALPHPQAAVEAADQPAQPTAENDDNDKPGPGWWTVEGLQWRDAALPQPGQFVALIQGLA